MAEIIKITVFNILKLNNAEFTNFMIRMLELIRKATLEKLGLDEAEVSAFEKNCELMTDLGNENRKLPETAKMSVVDTDRDERVSFVLGYTNIMCIAPNEAQRQSAKRLKEFTHLYAGIQDMPNEQETQKIRGLVVDLTKEGNAADTATLGLTDAVAQLKQVNETYHALSVQRNTAQTAANISASKVIRAEMSVQYDHFTTQAFIQSVANPTAETATFVKETNQLIANTQAAYKLRKSMAKANKSENPAQ